MKSLLLVLFAVFLVSCINEIFNENEYYYIVLDKEIYNYNYTDYSSGHKEDITEEIKLFVVRDSENNIFKVKPSIEDWNKYKIGDRIVTYKPYPIWRQ